MTTLRGLVAVVPTLSREPESLRALQASLEQAGAEVRLVVTGRTLDERLTREGVAHISPRANPGFGAAVTFGADAGPWDWLMIVNDDTEMTASDLGSALAPLTTRDPDDSVLLLLDPGERRPIPDARGVFLTTSLVGALASRLPGRRQAEPSEGQPYYKSFSLCVISRGLWERLDGFADSMIYTYEDADFTSRAWQTGAEVIDGGQHAQHEGSGTGGRHIATVLPVSVRSAQGYLRSIGVNDRSSRMLLGAALLARLVLVPFNKLPISAHARGVVGALGALRSGSETPRLPDYGSV